MVLISKDWISYVLHDYNTYIQTKIGEKKKQNKIEQVKERKGWNTVTVAPV